MTVGAWSPPAAHSVPDLDWLRAVARRCAAGIDTAADVRAAVDAADAESRAHLMRLAASDWAPVIAGLDDVELECLLRFFTLAEKALPGWEAGARSPVVPIARALRARLRWTPAMTQWIRAHSDNRFLPYGSVNG